MNFKQSFRVSPATRSEKRTSWVGSLAGACSLRAAPATAPSEPLVALPQGGSVVKRSQFPPATFVRASCWQRPGGGTPARRAPPQPRPALDHVGSGPPGDTPTRQSQALCVSSPRSNGPRGQLPEPCSPWEEPACRWQLEGKPAPLGDGEASVPCIVHSLDKASWAPSPHQALCQAPALRGRDVPMCLSRRAHKQGRGRRAMAGSGRASGQWTFRIKCGGPGNSRERTGRDQSTGACTRGPHGDPVAEGTRRLAACSPGRRQAVRSDFRCRERGTRRRPGRGRAVLGADGQHHLRPAPTRGPRRAQSTAWRHGAQQTPGNSSVNSEDTI